MQKSLELGAVVTAMPGLTGSRAAAFVEAASVCLWEEGHRCDSLLEVDGDIEARYRLLWKQPDEQVRRTYADPQEATEEGATAVAIAVLIDVTDYVVVSRSIKGTGFDYWLGHEAGNFAARMEVSGVRRGAESVVDGRLREKLRQMMPSDHRGLPGYAIVVEFGAPRARVATK
ncbi:hypothetical protein [Haliangium sp.]|uniref:hypothetical protein n=1 Tax=Haliangium sp. TaxID=2663208 RepID=UPI003D0EAE1B